MLASCGWRCLPNAVGARWWPLGLRHDKQRTLHADKERIDQDSVVAISELWFPNRRRGHDALSMRVSRKYAASKVESAPHPSAVTQPRMDQRIARSSGRTPTASFRRKENGNRVPSVLLGREAECTVWPETAKVKHGRQAGLPDESFSPIVEISCIGYTLQRPGCPPQKSEVRGKANKAERRRQLGVSICVGLYWKKYSEDTGEYWHIDNRRETNRGTSWFCFFSEPGRLPIVHAREDVFFFSSEGYPRPRLRSATNPLGPPVLQSRSRRSRKNGACGTAGRRGEVFDSELTIRREYRLRLGEAQRASWVAVDVRRTVRFATPLKEEIPHGRAASPKKNLRQEREKRRAWAWSAAPSPYLYKTASLCYSNALIGYLIRALGRFAAPVVTDTPLAIPSLPVTERRVIDTDDLVRSDTTATIARSFRLCLKLSCCAIREKVGSGVDAGNSRFYSFPPDIWQSAFETSWRAKQNTPRPGHLLRIPEFELTVPICAIKESRTKPGKKAMRCRFGSDRTLPTFLFNQAPLLQILVSESQRVKALTGERNNKRWTQAGLVGEEGTITFRGRINNMMFLPLDGVCGRDLRSMSCEDAAALHTRTCSMYSAVQKSRDPYLGGG
ncbi:hypothetical protein BC835DRAFT_1303534 [Cytidiella melzeri]|nr:hypothetical protein BC835DRAFT_1303534 [Cytidiella melzeri]